MGFGNFLNKLAGGTLTHDDPQQTVHITAQQAAPVVATPSATPMPDPILAAQPTIQDTPTLRPAPVQNVTPVTTIDPIPQPTVGTQSTDAIPQELSASLSQVTDSVPTPTDPTTTPPIVDTASVDNTMSMAIPPSTLASMPTIPSTSLADLSVTAYNALDTLAMLATQTAEITDTRKRYEDAVRALGDSHDPAAFNILFDLLLTHIEAELYKFPAFQEMGRQQSTLTITTTAFDTLVTATPIGKDICTPTHFEILKQLLEVTKLHEPTAYDSLNSAYKVLSI